jgi:TRAP-type C4-dicarboxylate transport system permease small subunit
MTMDMNQEITTDRNQQAALPLHRRVLNRFYAGCFAASMVALALMGLAVLAQIGGRLVGVTVPDLPDIAGFCMAASSFLSLAHTFREGGHVRVAMLLARLSDKRRLGFERFTLTVALLLAAMFAFYLVDMTIESFQYNAASSGVIAIPLWIPQTLMAAGVIAMTIALADLLVEAWCGNMPGYVYKEELPQ